MAPISVYDAQSQFSRLLAAVESGEEVVITRHRRPIARLVPVTPPPGQRRFGTLRGAATTRGDFDEPLTIDFLNLAARSSFA